MEALLKAAAARGKRRGMKVVSLGQGQGPIAEIAMQNGARSGEWVVLENCHLAQSWLPVLDNMLTDAGILGDEDLHPDFRLWLTSMPCAYFPVPTLQKGIKITTEPPRGLKANLRRTFADLSVEDFESGCAERMIQPWTRLVFALSFYNAVCLERKKFGAVGECAEGGSLAVCLFVFFFLGGLFVCLCVGFSQYSKVPRHSDFRLTV